jgi:hypothetical protein
VRKGGGAISATIGLCQGKRQVLAVDVLNLCRRNTTAQYAALGRTAVPPVCALTPTNAYARREDSGATFDGRANLCVRSKRHAALDRFRAFPKIADECEEWLIGQFYPHQPSLVQFIEGFDDGSFWNSQKRGTQARLSHG